MNRYIQPEIDIILFDEDELTLDSVTNHTYAGYELNKYMLGEPESAGTTTITIKKATTR